MIIKQVDADSIAQQCGIAPGDILISMNGREIRDYIDYTYESAPETVSVVLRKADGSEEEIEIEKEPGEELGVSFEDDGFGKTICCRNRCVFCFVDQLPKHLRKTLYVKDDDWRMSFLMGSFITLTNLTEPEIQRIVDQQLSPLYVSVHAYDDEVRRLLLGNEDAKNTFQLIRRLTRSGIRLHTQIVMCRGINDGAVLRETVEQLQRLYPGVLSVAVVPAGLTGHREGRFPLLPVDRETAAGTVRMVEALQKTFLQNGGTRFVFASDEMYIRAELPLPDYESYERFEQIENGVGLVRMFLQDAGEAIEDLRGQAPRYHRAGLITGTDFYPFLKKLAKQIERAFPVKLTVYRVENRFFGSSVTVAGLLTGKDIAEQVCPDDEEVCLLSRCCFRENDDSMLDDVTLSELSERLGVPCLKAGADGYELVQMLLKGEN